MSIRINLKTVAGILSVLPVLSLMVLYQIPTGISGSSLFILIAGAGLLFTFMNISRGVNSLYIPAFGVFLSITISFLANSITLPFSVILNEYLHATLWFWVFNIGTYFNYQDTNNRPFYLMIVCFILVSIYLQSSNFYSDYSVQTKFYSVTTCFYVLLSMPFTLSLPKRWVSLALFLCEIYICVMSFKRTIIVVTGIIVIAGLFLYLKDKKGQNKALSFILLGSIGVFIILWLINTNNEQINNVFSVWTRRFTEDQNGSIFGAARSSNINEIIYLVSKSDILSLMFGHGYEAVQSVTSTRLSAHNDFLELLFDYGIGAVVCYIVMIVNTVKVFLQKRANKHNMDESKQDVAFSSYSFLCAAIICSFAGMSSHLITYPTHFMILALFLGWASPKDISLRKQETPCRYMRGV